MLGHSSRLARLRRHWIALVGMFTLVFAQLAFAHTPCTGMAAVGDTSDEMAAMVCDGHCQSAQQTLDFPAPPAVMVDATALALPSASLAAARLMAVAATPAAFLPRITFPPPLLLHGRLRI